MKKRAFGQPSFNLKKVRLFPNLSGYAYKFTLIIPLLFKGKEVFSASDKKKLLDLLSEDFGGCTCSGDITHPLYVGTSMNKKGEIVKNNNAMYTVYALQTDESIEYFQALQSNLQEYSSEEKILVEMTSVTLL